MPFYVVVAALAVTASIPILLYALAADRAPVRRVTRNLNVGLTDGGDLRGLVLSQSPVEPVVQPLGRILARPAELQVGLVLALVGAPFFITLVRSLRTAGL